MPKWRDEGNINVEMDILSVQLLATLKFHTQYLHNHLANMDEISWLVYRIRQRLKFIGDIGDDDFLLMIKKSYINLIENLPYHYTFEYRA